MGRYDTSTVTDFELLPCQHEGHHELAEHPEGLGITCTECGARTWIPRVCVCGHVVPQAKRPHQEGEKPPCWFPRLAQGPNALRSLEAAIAASGRTVVITAREVLAGKRDDATLRP